MRWEAQIQPAASTDEAARAIDTADKLFILENEKLHDLSRSKATELMHEGAEVEYQLHGISKVVIVTCWLE